MTDMTDGLPVFHSMFYIPEEARLQDPKNRQNSVVAEDATLTDSMWAEMEFAYHAAAKAYDALLELGVAKEIARFVLPQGVYTRLYISGNVRSFIHYCNVRDEEGVVQYEHVELARAVRIVFAQTCPVITKSIWDETN